MSGCGCTYSAQGVFECGRSDLSTDWREPFKLSPRNDRTLTSARNEYNSQYSAATRWDGEQQDRVDNMQSFDARAVGYINSHSRTVQARESTLASANVAADQAVRKYL